ncbi:GntR family transcriptional regulator [Thermoactinomyces mirandus]|uniref:GntR family transcriptional regulator n=1 Tax=Thermoactinomyces mirandus TaxID=2756294 RepID=A0A7W2ARS3_9BACL|nr:GntR family transcriptional regulator [Thermoactinomyces mirandus]
MHNLNNSKIDEVMDIIRKKIEQGEYSSGERLPSERDMSEQLGVSRATVSHLSSPSSSRRFG